MFRALKKWAKGGNEDSKLDTPLGVRAMGQALQRKFARGVQYNSKLFRLQCYFPRSAYYNDCVLDMWWLCQFPLPANVTCLIICIRMSVRSLARWCL